MSQQVLECSSLYVCKIPQSHPSSNDIYAIDVPLHFHKVLQPNDPCGDAQPHLSSVILITNFPTTITLTVKLARTVTVTKIQLIEDTASLLEQDEIFKTVTDFSGFRERETFGATVCLLETHPVNAAGCSQWGAALRRFIIRSLRGDSRPPMSPVRWNGND